MPPPGARHVCFDAGPTANVCGGSGGMRPPREIVPFRAISIVCQGSTARAHGMGDDEIQTRRVPTDDWGGAQDGGVATPTAMQTIKNWNCVKGVNELHGRIRVEINSVVER